jgi:RavJ, Peptidase domain
MGLSKDKINSIIAKKTEWVPGNVAVTDLSRFSNCVPKTPEGVAATKASEDYHNFGKENDLDDKYIVPVIGKPKNSKEFLGLWKKRQDEINEGKIPSSECSNFSYDAIAESLLDDEIRSKYDVVQAGSMYINQGFGFTYAHNITLLVPKGADIKLGKITSDNPLPEGTLIIDPWARAMGQSAESSLFTTPENFCYLNSLYPLDVNYNSAIKPPALPFGPQPKSIDKIVQEFKESNVLKDFLAKAAELVDVDIHGEGSTKDVSEKLSTLIKDSLGLASDDNIKSFTIRGETQELEIEYESSGITHKLDEIGFTKGAIEVIEEAQQKEKELQEMVSKVRMIDAKKREEISKSYDTMYSRFTSFFMTQKKDPEREKLIDFKVIEGNLASIVHDQDMSVIEMQNFVYALSPDDSGKNIEDYSLLELELLESKLEKFNEKSKYLEVIWDKAMSDFDFSDGEYKKSHDSFKSNMKLNKRCVEEMKEEMLEYKKELKLQAVEVESEVVLHVKEKLAEFKELNQTLKKLMPLFDTPMFSKDKLELADEISKQARQAFKEAKKLNKNELSKLDSKEHEKIKSQLHETIVQFKTEVMPNIEKAQEKQKELVEKQEKSQEFKEKFSQSQLNEQQKEIKQLKGRVGSFGFFQEQLSSAKNVNQIEEVVSQRESSYGN